MLRIINLIIVLYIFRQLLIEPPKNNPPPERIIKPNIPSTAASLILKKYKPSQKEIEILNKLYRAIVFQESNNNYRAVNQDSGAIGLGQVLPSNIPSWCKRITSRFCAVQEFHSNPELQTTIIYGTLLEELRRIKSIYPDEDTDITVRRIASWWYSGNENLINNSRKQGKYPSIKQYTLEVLRKFKGIKND